MPEAVWKAYIDFEIENGQKTADYTKVRALYERLLSITQHVKVWISYAQFEDEQANNITLSRVVYEKANTYFKENQPDLKEERVMVIENWLEMESKNGDSKEARLVRDKMPKRVKKRRQVDEGWEEYYDYVFPDDQGQAKNIKIV